MIFTLVKTSLSKELFTLNIGNINVYIYDQFEFSYLKYLTLFIRHLTYIIKVK